MVRPTIPTSTDERKSFHNTIENIIKDRTRYNYRVLKTFHAFPTPYIDALNHKLAPSGVSHSSSHLYSPHMVFTSAASSHNFLPSLPRIFIEIFLITLLIL